ncbi:hypothetical protein [Kitasatospora sp. GP82]|uniref:hypothetical protein n=1 Tax=Kitasatospora sp. GP82 TaxID=3035089 RepID=UPI0024766D96|nr:hypothetical protein [Kitasatospora sp. GP82]MDH6128530.1 hypothetical protein [Kitasatospora sp. GP82]
MKHASKLVGTVGAVALAAGLTLTATGTASATSGVCTANDNVWVCNNYDPAGYNASLRVLPDSNVDGHFLDFNLVCGSKRFGDRGGFWAYSSHEDYSYTFAVGSQGTCSVWLYDRTSGASWSSPSVTR